MKQLYFLKYLKLTNNLFYYKKIKNIPIHLKINLSQKKYILEKNNQPFPTIPKIITYYTRHDLPIQNTNHIKLLHPIARP